MGADHLPAAGARSGFSSSSWRTNRSGNLPGLIDTRKDSLMPGCFTICPTRLHERSQHLLDAIDCLLLDLH